MPKYSLVKRHLNLTLLIYFDCEFLRFLLREYGGYKLILRLKIVLAYCYAPIHI